MSFNYMYTHLLEKCILGAKTKDVRENQEGVDYFEKLSQSWMFEQSSCSYR